MDYITYTDLGPYLSTNDQKQIVLRHNEQPIFPVRFDDEQMARKLIVEINRLYGSDLEWLGWSNWLSDLRQIHMDQMSRYRFGEFVDSLLSLRKYSVTTQDCIECWKKLGSD